jgi:hypothetical protein
MKTQFTPGPWKATKTSSHVYHDAGNEHDGVICKMAHAGSLQWACKDPSSLENTANARLIAASPSMYDALAAIANMQVQETTDFRELAALCISIAHIEIAKLEGRS